MIALRFFFGQGGGLRSPGISAPNRVLYQLSYTLTILVAGAGVEPAISGV